MTKRLEPIVFFGNERLATGVTTQATTLYKLIDAGYDIKAVVVNNEPTASRKQRELEIAALANQYNIPVLNPSKPADIADQLRSYDAVIGVLVAYGRIIPQSIIDIFPRGIVNIHPSLLPLHRGPTPIESSMIEGSPETGISIMQLTKEMDAGPVYMQKKQHLNPNYSSKQLITDILLAAGGDLLISCLPPIISCSLQPTAQDDTKATYDKLITKEDGIIDWRKDAKRIKREILAYAGWPRSRATLGGKEVIITEVEVLDTITVPGKISIDNNNLIIGCKWGAIKIIKLIPAGKKEMSAKAFIAGYGRSVTS